MWSSTLMILGSGVVLPSRGVVSSMRSVMRCSSVAANGTSGASASSSARTERRSPARMRSTTSVTPRLGEVLELALARRWSRRERCSGRPDRDRPARPSARSRGSAVPRPPPPMGIHPSSVAAAASTVSVAPPPTRVRTRGRWTGLGHDQVGPKSTNSPWNSASSHDQIASMAARCSATMARRRGKSTPWSSASARFHP